MKAHIKADLTLKLVGMYQRGGMPKVEEYLKRTGRDCFLKRHHNYTATLEGTRIFCKEILEQGIT